jgi:hypothetical protein
VLPFAFERTGSQTVRRLNERLSSRRALAESRLADARFPTQDAVRG